MDETISAATDPTPREPPVHHFEWFAGVLALVLALNFFDTVATIWWTQTGLATEANPLMAELLSLHPTVFAATKLLLVGVGVIVLWRHRRHWMSHLAGLAAGIAYAAIGVYHLYGATLFV